MSTPTPPKPASTADTILSILDGILATAGTLIPFGQLADFLLKIIQKGVAAYEANTGSPIDPSLIKPIDPIP